MKYLVYADGRVLDIRTLEVVDMNPEDARIANERSRRWDGLEDDLRRDTGESELDACEQRESLFGGDWGL